MKKRVNKVASARGGAVTASRSPAKAAALKALHARMRGKRIHIGPSRERETALADLHALLERARQRGVISIRKCATDLRVSDRTVRRWLAGVDWPPTTAVRAVREWVARHQP
jgi:hypothetical protein